MRRKPGESPRRRIDGLTWLGLVVAAAAVGSAVARIFFGVDVTDEAFYVAMPWRFAHGARPFVDEYASQQMSAFFTVPAVWLWSRVFGSTGIVLFLRFCYLAFLGGVAASAYAYLRRLIAPGLALMASAIVLVYVPLGIPALSYNTIGVGLLTAGCFLGLIVMDGAGPRAGVWPGLLHALACVAYPSLAVAVAAFFLAALALTPKGRRAWLAWYAGAVAGVAAVTAGALLAAGIENVRGSLEFAQRFGRFGGGISKLRRLLQGAVTVLATDRPWLLPATALWIALYSWRRRLGVALLVALPVAAVSLADAYSSSAQGYFWTAIGFAGAAVALVLVRTLRQARPLAFCVLLPGLAAAAALAYTSTNDIHQAGVALPGAVLAAVSLVAVASAGEGRRLSVAVPAIVAILVLGLSADLTWVAPYRDGSIASMTGRVAAGPFAGMRTTPRNAEFVEQLGSDLAPYSERSLLCYDALPAGYLFSSGPPASPTAWIPSPEQYPQMQHDYVVTYLERQGRMPEVVLRTAGYDLKSATATVAADPLAGFLTSPPYEKAVVRERYGVFVRR